MNIIPEGVPPMVSEIKYDLEDLNQLLLEKNAEKYLEVLNYLSENYSRETIQSILNIREYRSWYSNHVLALSLLVGKLVAVDDNTFYGSDLPEGIPEILAIQILDKMMSIGVDIWVSDYYGDTIMSCFNGNKLGSRNQNDHFKVRVREYYNRN